MVVVDVGCGTGILSILCAQDGAKRPNAVDASDFAVKSMLGSVITARDHWLKHGGLILPSNATLYMAPVTHPDRYGESIDFWQNVYGINMSAMLPLAKQCAFEEPSVESISGENVLTWPHVEIESGFTSGDSCLCSF
ncbi:probable protein arginine N-methyltransferase 6 isoform X1 [Populus nigra]|uniref:probable protein arginine N-methyltransferase 6 isoform X1 n=1 Tax=Populus nigra TaxID=3691 RepID=UPI002B269001|nr:probable protein arginine N-methyltransferase 6 isoform X1 [Populus nigra]